MRRYVLLLAVASVFTACGGGGSSGSGNGGWGGLVCTGNDIKCPHEDATIIDGMPEITLVCVDTTSDQGNCGGCWNLCGANSSCKDSACTPCTPSTCAEIGCGEEVPNGCNGTTTCECPEGTMCSSTEKGNPGMCVSGDTGGAQ